LAPHTAVVLDATNSDVLRLDQPQQIKGVPHNMAPQAKRETLEQRVTGIENWLKWLLRASGITLVGLLAFAFWLGTISSKVSSSEQTVNKVYGAVSEDPNSLLVRTSLIESRLNGVELKLNSMDSKLDNLVNRLDLRERNSVTVKPLPNPSPEQH
jgi:hypothetical protein